MALKNNNTIDGGFNAARIMAALGRIGYNPVSAILDIVDNSISANSTKISIKINLIQKKEKNRNRTTTKTIIDSFVIIDNGEGIDEAGIHNALSLGSSKDNYHSDTLSKFGLGLKSASSSLGKRLTICSRKTNRSSGLSAILDQRKLTDKYEYTLTNPTKHENDLLDSHCGKNKSGTIIIIDQIHHESMPKVIEIIDGIKKKAGIIFYYHLLGKDPAKSKIDLKLKYEEHSDQIEAYDPLFINEIDKNNPNLDERKWLGKSVNWNTKPQKIQLSKDGNICATVEITQLPHPVVVGKSGVMTQSACRKKYNIGAGNYGFYIYRNGRLISWADSLNGLLKQDQDLYSFRGRLLISSDADDILNLDVTKSRIHLSELARSQLESIISEAKKKSINAWKNAYQEYKRDITEDPHAEVNSELDRIGDLNEKGEQLDEDVAPIKEKKKLQNKRKKIIAKKPIKPKEAKNLQEKGQRVQYVDDLDYNQLWERAHDPEEGLIVRVNKSHGLYRDIISVNLDNKHLIQTLDILFYSLAAGEKDVLYKGGFDNNLVENILEEFRERVGSQITDILRQRSKNL